MDPRSPSSLLVIILLIYPSALVLSQSSSTPASEPCQLLLDAATVYPQCAPHGNCTGLSCQQSTGGSRYNASFVVTKCVDPVTVDLLVDDGAGGSSDQQTFNGSANATFTGSGDVTVDMRRNASQLQFEARLTSSNAVLIPLVHVPLNASVCLCNSLSDLAQVAAHPVLEPGCSTNAACDGVRCELDIFGAVYYIEVVVHSCNDSVGVLVEDSNFNVISRAEFNQSETRSLQVGFISLQAEVVIVKHPYSMEVQSFVTEPIFGRVEIIPRHTIILDKTNCSSNPDTPTLAPPVTPPPAVTTPIPPPPATATEACQAFYDIIINTRTDSFACVPFDPCESGISCRLNILDTHYIMNISVTTSGDVMFIVWEGPTGRLLSSAMARNVSIPLPKPTGGVLQLGQSRQVSANNAPSPISFLVVLLVPDLANPGSTNTLSTVLIPLTTIPFIENCNVLSDYSDRYSQCTSLGTCSGAQCQVEDSIASFAVTKCVDPVSVNVRLQSRTTGVVSAERAFTQSDGVHVGDSSLLVEMGRNATDLYLEATLIHPGSPNVTAIPQVIVPLNASQCMCESLSLLASESGGTLLEPECYTNDRCNGVICELDIFGNVFYMESIILPCEYAVDVVIRDSNRQPTFMSYFNRTETHVINLGLFSANLYVEIIRHDYSMEVSAVVDAFIFLNITLVPRHTIILDKTQCNTPDIKIITPPTAPPPPTPPPSSASDICHAFYDIISATSGNPFFCQAMKNCETGIMCTLEILDTFYTVSIMVQADGKSLAFSVTDSDGRKVGGATSKNVSVPLAKPEGGSLVFNQSVSVDKGTVGFSLSLVAPNIGSGSSQLMVHSLIDYTELPITISPPSLPPSPTAQPQRQASQSAAVIAIPVIIALLLSAIITVLSFWGCLVYCRRRDRTLPFQFRYMKEGDDLQALDVVPQENGGGLEDEDEIKVDLANDSGVSHDNGTDYYEKTVPSKVHSEVDLV